MLTVEHTTGTSPSTSNYSSFITGYNSTISTVGDDDLTLPAELPTWQVVLLSTLLTFLVIATIVGNGLVVVAIHGNRQLRTLTNYLVLSLACTDLLVSLLVMPLSAAYLIMGKWVFGTVVCYLFIGADVVFCTVSILHLLAIAVDRYKTVTDVTYNRGSTLHKRIVPIMVTGAWVLSVITCLPAFVVWKTEQSNDNCIISQDHAYTVYSTVLAFYAPSVAILCIYVKIFLVVRARTRQKAFQKKQSLKNSNLRSSESCDVVRCSVTMTTLVNNNAMLPSDTPKPSPATIASALELNPDRLDELASDEDNSNEELEATWTAQLDINNQNEYKENTANIQLIQKQAAESARSRQKRLVRKRERKAFKTLGIITGVFMFCWLPFFMIALVNPFVGQTIPVVVINLVTWLGYFNCMLNPIIYTIFNPEFRKAFKTILTREQS